MLKVFDAESTGTAVSEAVLFQGGIGTVAIDGATPGTIQLEMKAEPGGNWLAVGDPIDADVMNFELPGSVWVRLSRTGGSGALDAYIGGVTEKMHESGGSPAPSRLASDLVGVAP